MTTPTTTTAKHISLGARFGGSCAICGSTCHDLAKTSLYRKADGKFVVVHPACAGGSTKSAVGGGAKYRTEPKGVIEIAE